jgi:ADP-heptose:LPS heptosyltransferase/GT2 family glycosyltransferase
MGIARGGCPIRYECGLDVAGAMKSRRRVAKGRRNIPLVVDEAATGLNAGAPAIANAGAAPNIGIDIDPVVSGGFIHDRYDVLIRGRAVSTLPIEEVSISLDQELVGRLQFGATDPLEVDEASGIQHVFHINVPLPRAQARRTCHCVITARTQTGDSASENFELAIDPSSPLPVEVSSGPTLSCHAYSYTRPPLVLYVERAAIDPGGQVLVHGWAVSLHPMVTVQVFIDDERIGAAQLGGQRNDIGTAFPVYPNARYAGFTLSKGIVGIRTETVAALRVQAISRQGFMHESVLPVERVRALATGHAIEATPAPAATVAWSPTLQPPSYRLEASFRIAPDLPTPLSRLPADPSMVSAIDQDERRSIRFFCDELALDAAGNLRAVGWAVCAVGIASITVYVDGEQVGVAELGLPRQDVGEEFRHISMARFSGFRLIKSLGALPSGEHSVRLALRNSLDDVEAEVRSLTIEHAPQTPPALAFPTEFRLEIDTPMVVAGTAVEPVTGRLTIEGWALARSGIAGIEVLLDDQRLGDAHYGLARQDVGIAFPDWQDSLRSGYAFHCPPRSLRDGQHVVHLKLRARSGQILEHRFTILVRKSEDAEEGLTIRQRITQVEIDVAEDLLGGLEHRPSFRLVMRQGSEIDPAALLATLGSLRNQAYRDWHLDVLAKDSVALAGLRVLLAEAAADLSDRIAVIEITDEAFGQPIGGNGNAQAQLIGFLSPGDRLGCDALLRIALASAMHQHADLLYADEVRISPASGEREPFFKPDFSPDLLLSTNYIGRPWFASARLLGRIQLRRRDLVENGEYDALLRCAEQAAHVQHVASLLCQRGHRQIDDATVEQAALSRAAARLGVPANIMPGAVPGTWRLCRTEPASGLVSIIIPTCASRGFIETCIRSLRERTAYRDFEIVCVDNIPDEQVAWKLWLQQNADTIVPMPDAFNWSRFNNSGVRHAKGEFLLFLNDDIEVLQPEWLDAMLEHARRPEVAIVGPQLLYPDNKVQHAGMFLAKRGTARHAFRFAAATEPGYFGLALTQRNVIAVTGACMLTRRSVYEALGGFEEAHDIINNDLDFCLRAHRAGLRIIFTPYASLVHHEAASRDRLEDTFDFRHFEARWRSLFSGGDPYFSPRLSRHSDDYRPDEEPIETIYPGHPLFRHSDIKRILVVKVDHIGDFVTAIPAIRRLKQIFPSASIHVLASRAARAFVAEEACIDELIEFEFFHSVSGLGQKQISKEEYQALRERLAPFDFDIAIDLRKHPDTREVLRHTPARFLAGYDYMGRFPFLNIALEWEGDNQLQRKRSHVTDDLINLVEAIGTAGRVERTRLSIAAPPDFLPEAVRRLFEKPVVAVHPGVGNAMRQWPAEHFASLVDLMIERNGVSAVLIGGPEEAELADVVLGQIGNSACVASLIGKTSLRQLPALLQACALYIGNNSGPKHMVAALGVPTIGIHSGVVDAIEWGRSAGAPSLSGATCPAVRVISHGWRTVRAASRA